MVQHNHGSKNFVAQRIFTDREEPKALAKRAIDQPQSRDEHRVVSWYGVGGQGKTSLCREITHKFLRKEGIVYADLDFVNPDHRILESAMLKLRSDLGQSRKLRFPMFDLAYARLFKMQYKGQDIRKVHPQLFRKKGSEVVDWLEEIGEGTAEGLSIILPGANVIYKYAKRLTGHLSEWWSEQGVKERVERFDALSPAELTNALPECLGNDLYRAQAEAGCPRIVIVADTHEKLWASESAQGAGENLLVDQWLRHLADQTPGVLVLLFGRDRIRWGEVDPDWNSLLEQHVLGGLSEGDAERFLLGIPIEDPEIRHQIIKGSEGLPYYLDLAVEQYVQMLNNKTIPNKEAFGENPVKVTERFLEHLGDEERRELRLGSYPEKLDQALFTQMAGEFFGGRAMANWPRLARRSVMTHEQDHSLTMQGIMRDALQSDDRKLRSQMFGEIHSYLFRHFDALIQAEDPKSISTKDEVALLAAAHHGKSLPASEYFDWLETRYEQFSRAARWTALEQLFNASIPVARQDSADMAFVLDCLSRSIQARGGHAEPMIREALRMRETLFGPDDILTATSYDMLAVELAVQGHASDAEPFFRKALTVRKAVLGTNDLYTAMSYGNLATNLDRQRRHKDAESLYRKALEIMEKAVGEHDDTAKMCNDLASNLERQGRPVEAHSLFCRAYKLNERLLGVDHPSTTASMTDLAYNLEACGRDAEAEPLFRRVLEIRKDSFGREHCQTAKSYSDLAFYLETHGDAVEAEALCREALGIRERLLGDGHPSTVISRAHLAMNLSSQGRTSEAEPLLRKSLEINERLLGAEHPDTVKSHQKLALNLESQRASRGGRLVSST